MAETYSGDIVPSYVRLFESNGTSGYTRGLNEVTFRFGQVIAQYAPDTDGNFNKRFWEYDVSVQHVSEGGAQTQIVYPRCQMASLFGGVADHIEWTPRLSLNAGGSTQGKPGLNSIVALLCLNSNVRQALIVGGLKHPGLPQEKSNLGHHLVFEFNGIKIDVNKDGEFNFLRRGPTDANGDPISEDDKNANASAAFLKGGSLVLANGTKTQFLSIGSGGADVKRVDLTAGQALQECSTAIETFESQAPTYLSDQVWTQK